MDKWIVNNYIVQMRHSVAQARVQVLNKLVREIRKLQMKKGTDEQKEKNSRKAERLRQEVIFIKKLDADELSKYALLSTADPSEILSKVSLSIEERSKVRLAAHKSIIQQVEIFRAKYPEWELKLPPLLVQLGLQIKNKRKAVTQESNSVTAISDVMRNNRNSKENCESEKVTVTKSSDSVTAISNETRDNKKSKRKSETDNKALKNENVIQCVKRNTEKTRKKDEEERKRIKDETIENESESISDTENISTTLSSQEKFQEPSNEISVLCDTYEGKRKKINGIAEVRRFADLLESDGNSENESSTEEEEDPNRTNSVTDPFFLTGNNSGESSDELKSSEEEEEKDERNSSFRSRDQFFVNKKNKNSEIRYIREKDQRWNLAKNNTTGRYSRGDQKVPTMNRKQRRMLERTRPELKKGSAFSQTGSSFTKRFQAPGQKKSLLNPGEIDFTTGSSAVKQEKLHPSWEAKRKQKELILPFQGKKIKFDDDGD